MVSDEAGLTVDPTSKAARGTLYDSNGNLANLHQRVVGSYEAPIAVPNMAYVAAQPTVPRTVWRMFSYESSRFVRLRHLRISAAFMMGADGRAEATTAVWQVYRFAGINAPTDGMLAATNYPVTYVPKKKSAGYPNSGVVLQTVRDIADPPPLSVVGLLAEPAFLSIPATRSANPGGRKPTLVDLHFRENSAMWLDPGHGLGIMQTTAIGDTSMFGVDALQGFVEWDEIEFERLPWK